MKPRKDQPITIIKNRRVKQCNNQFIQARDKSGYEFTGYLVNQVGQVISDFSNDPLHPTITPGGYSQYTLYPNNSSQKHTVTAHQLAVWSHYKLAPSEDDYVIAHIETDKIRIRTLQGRLLALNNSLDNLSIKPHKQNLSERALAIYRQLATPKQYNGQAHVLVPFLTDFIEFRVNEVEKAGKARYVPHIHDSLDFTREYINKHNMHWGYFWGDLMEIHYRPVSVLKQLLKICKSESSNKEHSHNQYGQVEFVKRGDYQCHVMWKCPW